ncbi:hypothetical protein CRENBAI_014217 [Crenichthys baileyi]|uniref:Uncharacterized protein n=1 Tax=Crenichthys baileyi TaxID=28760 RepID=A0AAV9QTV5_9TELE
MSSPEQERRSGVQLVSALLLLLSLSVKQAMSHVHVTFKPADCADHVITTSHLEGFEAT